VSAIRALVPLLVAASLTTATTAAVSAPARTTAGGGGYWLVLNSNRDGQARGYTMRPDGSRLSPLLRRGRTPVPSSVSGDGGTIAYGTDNGIYMSRANGTALHNVVRHGEFRGLFAPSLSPNGRLLAFAGKDALWIVGTDGRGLRRQASDPHSDIHVADWSPDGRALVLVVALGGDISSALAVQPLHGERRVLVRGVIEDAAWSPDGRWIAYERQYDEPRRGGLYLVQPNGAHRHRVVRGQISSFAWSPDGKRLAVAIGYPADVAVVGVDGRGLKRLRLNGPSTMQDLNWSPDGHLLAFEAEQPNRSGGFVWIVRTNGRALRRLMNGGTSEVIGWTRLAPVLPSAPPLLPSERVVGESMVATGNPVAGISADGTRVAVIVPWTAADCDHVVVWTLPTRALERFFAPRSKCEAHYFNGGEKDVELAGFRAAWTENLGCGNSCEVVLESATLGQHSSVALASAVIDRYDRADFGLRGDGDLLVFNDGSRLVRIGTGRESCAQPSNPIPRPASICTTLRSGAHATPVASVSGGLIAIREPEAVAVVDVQGELVGVFPFARDEVKAARLDGGRLVVARSGMVEVYDVATGARERQRALPSGYTLADVDGGIAVLLGSDSAIVLLRLEDGRSLRLAPGRGPRFADLEPPGLYYSYATDDGGGRVVFLSRSELLRQLG
jgi:Tol biopolymer transport system component